MRSAIFFLWIIFLIFPTSGFSQGPQNLSEIISRQEALKKELKYLESQHDIWDSYASHNRWVLRGTVFSGGVALTALSLLGALWIAGVSPTIVSGAETLAAGAMGVNELVGSSLIFGYGLAVIAETGSAYLGMEYDSKTGQITLTVKDEKGKEIEKTTFKRLDSFIATIAKKHGMKIYDGLGQIERELVQAEHRLRVESRNKEETLCWYEKWWGTYDTQFMYAMADIYKFRLTLIETKINLLEEEIKRLRN